MTAIMTFFAAIGMIVAVTSFLALILWIAIKIEDRKRGIRKPPNQTVNRPEAPVLGTQIRRPGNTNEVNHRESFNDW